MPCNAGQSACLDCFELCHVDVSGYLIILTNLAEVYCMAGVLMLPGMAQIAWSLEVMPASMAGFEHVGCPTVAHFVFEPLYQQLYV